MTSTARRDLDTPGEPGGHTSQPPGRVDGPRSTLSWLWSRPLHVVRRGLQVVRATPGRLSVIMAGLIVLCLVSGLFGILSVQDRLNTIDELTDRREPVAVAAQKVYRSLSDADATIVSALSSSGPEPSALRNRYQEDLTEAGSALATAASDSAAVAEAQDQVDALNRKIPVYTGLIETARARHRQDDLSGSVHLHDASRLMHTEILPAAHTLYETDTERVLAEQETATDFPWSATLFAALLVVALVGTQIYLKRKTNRVFNIGLVVSTVGVGIAVLWTAIALLVQGALVGEGREDGTEEVDLLVGARIAALQARTNETLALTAEDESVDYEREFTELFERFAGPDGAGGLLAQARHRSAENDSSDADLDDAAQAASAWLRTHGEVRELVESEDEDKALALTIDPQDERSTAVASTQIDEDLASAIGERRQAFVDNTTQAGQAFTLLTPGLVLLTLVSALGAAFGIHRRLREYR